MEVLAYVGGLLLLTMSVVFGYGQVKQRLGRSREQKRFQELIAEQEAIDALRAKNVAAAPDRSPAERADLVRRLSEISARGKREA